jgi:hypothetical protein
LPTDVLSIAVVIAAVPVVAIGTVGCGCAHCRRTDTDTDTAPIAVAAIAVTTIAVASGYAPAAHSDSAAPVSPSRDRAAPVVASTAPIAGTSATASIGVFGDQAGGEKNECCKSSENIAKHDSISL